MDDDVTELRDPGFGFFRSPTGPSLKADQARELDDELFRSEPLEYFHARIATLIASFDRSDNLTSTLATNFSAALGVDDPSSVLSPTAASRELQVAIDSFAVRHHAAEALVRLYHALTVPADRTDPAPCVWARIADGPFSLADVVKKAQSHLDRNRDSFWRLILPGPANTELEADKLNRALSVLGAWLGHAMHLLMRDDIDVNAAHNKVKHGLAVRAGIDLATFTPKPLESGAPVPISAVTGPSAVDIFAGPTLDYLARPHKINGRRQGLEITTLNLNPATLLAEGWMIATTFGAMFHIAAARHFSGRTTELAAYPRLPLGPTPRELLPDAVVVGLRQP